MPEKSRRPPRLQRQDTVNEDVQSKEKPPHIAALLGFARLVFFVYDVITFIPFKIFANPEDKLQLSSRIKAKPEDGDNTKPWHYIGKERVTEMFPGCDTVAAQWMHAVEKFGEKDCLGTREVLKIHKEVQANGRTFEKWELGNYHWRSYVAANRRVNMIATGLAELGQEKGRHVVLFAETREEWLTTALACFKQGFPIVTVYATLGEEAVEYAISQVDATTIFTTSTLIDKVYKAIDNGAHISNVVYFSSPDPEGNGVARKDGVNVLAFDDLLNKGQPDEISIQCKADDIALIMYTSGTTGAPKGVMLTHRNIVAATAGQSSIIPIGPGDTYIGYLPLAHILEVCGEVVSLSKGTRIGYSSAQTLFDRAPKIAKGTKGDCYALQPTLMACVPAVMDRIYKAVIDEVNSKSPLFKELFKLCYDRKRMRYEEGYTSIILNKLVFDKISKLLGGHLRVVLSGGAPLSAETQRFMNICFCCPVIQGYGLTETCGGGTLADHHDLSTGTVGPPLPCCEILLEDWKEAGYSPLNEVPTGEILIGGDNVCMGYYKNPEKTKEDFVTRNGKRYFATGDIGEFRPDGSLKIIDRKKDLLKLQHGEYVSLGKVETAILTNPLIDNICVYGDSSKDHLIALVVPNEKNVRALAEKKGVAEADWEEMCADEKVAEAVLKELTAYVGSKLQRVEMPKKIHLCSEAWTPASGLLTEALKLKRKNIENEFRAEIDRLYR